MATYKPFVLAGIRSGAELADVATDIKGRLEGAGFAVVGEGAPFEGSHIIAFTSEALKSKAAASTHGGFGAVLRVGLTKIEDKIQISYTHPSYWAMMCRINEDNADVTAALSEALGAEDTFGHKKGLEEKKIRTYHYKLGMPFFNEPHTIKKFDSHAAAVAAVEAGLAANKGGCSSVYQVALPDKEEVVFGVFIDNTAHAKGSDAHVMGIIDAQEYKHLPHLPYEVLVSGSTVFALKAKFRIAASFPGLDMIGSHGFSKIMAAPDAIKGAITAIVA